MAGAGKKTFTAGEILTASDTNTYLMEQTVMYFAGTASRASAIPTPSTGMTTYIGTTGTASIPQIESYTGSAWQTPYGMTLVATAPLSGASVQVDNCFSSAFQNYQVVLSGVTFSTDAGMIVRIGTTASNTAYYFCQSFGPGGYSGSSIQIDARANTTFFEVGCTSDSTHQAGAVFHLENPFNTVNTNLQALGTDARTGGAGARIVTGFLNNTTSYSGLYFQPSAGTITAGTVRIYGYRNS
jgi:hypothetical protein